jgi:hypothetical protein
LASFWRSQNPLRSAVGSPSATPHERSRPAALPHGYYPDELGEALSAIAADAKTITLLEMDPKASSFVIKVKGRAADIALPQSENEKPHAPARFSPRESDARGDQYQYDQSGTFKD